MRGVEETWGVAEDGRAFSREAFFVRGARLPEDPEPLLRELDRRYYRWIPRLTGELVAIVKREGGGQAARVIEIGPTGLVLGPARIERSPLRVERSILGGWLVAEPSGTLAQELVPREGGVEVAVHLRGFVPRLFSLPLGALLYDVTQEAIHRRLSRAYLRHDVAPLLRSLACSSSTPTRT